MITSSTLNGLLTCTAKRYVTDYHLNKFFCFQFYYHKSDYDADLGHHLGKVYSIPYASLIYHLKHGIAGEFVKDYADESRFSVQVTNGLLYSTAEQSTEDSFYRYLTLVFFNSIRFIHYFLDLFHWKLME